MIFFLLFNSPTALDGVKSNLAMLAFLALSLIFEFEKAAFSMDGYVIYEPLLDANFSFK